MTETCIYGKLEENYISSLTLQTTAQIKLQVTGHEMPKHYDVASNFVNNLILMKVIISYIFFKHVCNANRLIK
jgi:hypothetical protein